MKKVISLILVAVMLLGALPVLASAETEATAKFTGYTVSLGESIAVEFYTDAANVADFAKVVFYKNGTLMEDATITSCPAADANGRVYFKFSQLGPHEMDATIKAELYLTTSDVAVNTASVSVLDYCTAVYAQGNEKLDTLIVNMLNYGAAAETHENDGTAISEHAVTLGIDLSTIGDATVNALKSTVYQEVEGATVEITKAALVLNAGIVPRFTFTAEDVSGLTAMVSCAGKTWEIKSFEETETANTYTFDFNGMNPSRVRSGILVAFKNANGDLVSNIRVFTAEHYAASATDDSVKALTGAMLHYGDAAKAYVTRNISSGALTEEEKTVLSALTVEPYAATEKGNQNVVIWAYGEAGIDVSANFDKSVFTLMKVVFSESGGVRSLVQPSNSDYDATYSGMLVDGYYGGAAVTEIESKTFSEADLQVGDVFFAVFYEPDPEDLNKLVKRYCAGVYLGSGKFLMSQNPGGSWTTAIETNTVIGIDLAEKYDIYFILRPEQVAPRDFTSGVMTNMEKAVISALTVEQYQAAITADGEAVKGSGIAIWAYAQAGIDVSANFDENIMDLMLAIFDGDTNGRYPYLPNSASYKAQYSRMLVDGYYAGAHVTWDKGFENADFQAGDVFLAVHYPDLAATGTRKYYAGICLGGDNFLISNNAEGTYSKTTAIKTFDEIVNENMGIYFVLRPEQLAQEAPKGLIAETRAKLSALTVTELQEGVKGDTDPNDTRVIKWFCKQAGMTENDVKNFSGIKGISNSILNKSGTWTYMTGTTTYHKLVVDGYYGGVKLKTANEFTQEDFLIGDIFCAQDSTGKIGYVGLYQGDGNFLMIECTISDGLITDYRVDTELVFGDLVTSCNYYFVLRPAQYLNTPAS